MWHPAHRHLVRAGRSGQAPGAQACPLAPLSGAWADVCQASIRHPPSVIHCRRARRSSTAVRSVCVMRNTLVILFLLLGVVVQAAELTPSPDLKSPGASDEKRESEITKICLEWWLKNRGLLAEESFKVAGYFSVARPIAKFAARDDRVWEVRVLHLHTGGPTGILWINDKTEKVIALGAEEKE